MESIESDSHSFVVKIWLVELSDADGRITWRGQVTHVPSGQRTYFTDLDELTTCLSSYLKQWGVKPPWFKAVRRWLKFCAAYCKYNSLKR